MSRIQQIWDLMRIKKEFSAKMVMKEVNDTTAKAYLGAFERGGYVIQTKQAWRAIDREYLLILDTGEKAPTYRTKKGDKQEEEIIDNNISRSVFLKGRKTNYDPTSKLFIELKKIIGDGFSYKKGLALFENKENKKGYNYPLYHYYLKKLGI